MYALCVLYSRPICMPFVGDTVGLYACPVCDIVGLYVCPVCDIVGLYACPLLCG